MADVDWQSVVVALAATDPVYDYVWCSFCGAVPPTGDDLSSGEDHRDGCVWWSARRLLNLSPWPQRPPDADAGGPSDG